MRVVTLLALSALVAGCGAPDGGEDMGTPAHLEGFTFSDDRRSVEVEFRGRPEFDPQDPCSAAYRGTTAVVGDRLEVGVYAEQHLLPIPTGLECDEARDPETGAIQHRTLTLQLTEPFNGSEFHDLSGQVILLEPPDDMAVIGDLPEDWRPQQESSYGGSMTPHWLRLYSPTPGGWENNEGLLEITEGFGGPVEHFELFEPDQVETVVINGQDATFSTYSGGRIQVEWSIGDDGLLMSGNLTDFNQEEFIALAESVSIPGD